MKDGSERGRKAWQDAELGLRREQIAPGAAGDLVLVDLAHPQMMPARDPLRSLVFHAADRAVRHVFVAGRQVLADGRPTLLDVGEAAGILADSQAKMLRDAVNYDYLRRTGDAIAPLSLPLDRSSDRPAGGLTLGRPG